MTSGESLADCLRVLGAGASAIGTGTLRSMGTLSSPLYPGDARKRDHETSQRTENLRVMHRPNPVCVKEESGEREMANVDCVAFPSPTCSWLLPACR
jgi:hypothetical protein